MTHPDPSPASAPPKKLLTFQSGGWVLLLAGFFTLVAAGLVLYPVYMSGGFHRYIGDGKSVDTYGFDLSNLTLPKGELSASGHPKDYLREIPENLVETITPDQVKLIAANEHIRFLVPSDRVVGVSIAGIARAYPVRILNIHQMVNDTLGDGPAATPIAVTFSTFTDSVVVFDRRIDGPDAPPAEFGNSGLLVRYNAVYFDRRANTTQESLWPQLALHAISGPHAGKPLTLVPYELTTWQDWSAKHPDTRVLLGLRTLKVEYSGDPFSTYHANDALPFAPLPNWPFPALPKKTPILVHSADGITWTAAPPQTSVPPAETRLYTYLFGWYAQHPADTDYSAFLPASRP